MYQNDKFGPKCMALMGLLMQHLKFHWGLATTQGSEYLIGTAFFLCFLTQPSQSFIGIICLLDKYVNHYSLEPLLIEWLDN